ncbi:MAG: sugar nucleotide-binding protein [Eubacteriales bacterium]
MKNIVITGGTGFLGGRLVEFFKNQYHVLAPCRKDLPFQNFKLIREYMKENQPDYLIHCAAISDTVYAQNNPQEHYDTNVLYTEYLARVCKEIGTKMIFMSSDQVYSGKTVIHGCSLEEVPPLKVGMDEETSNIYGRGKLQAETKVCEILKDGVSLRLTWMYDWNRLHVKNKPDFLSQLLEGIDQGRELFYSTEYFRGITYVKEVVENMEKVFLLPGGVYNYGASCDGSLYQVAKATTNILGQDDDLIRENETPFNRNLSMDTKVLENYGIYFSSTIKGLERVVKENSL